LKKYLLLFILLTTFFSQLLAQQSVARRWNEVALAAVRSDRARPPVIARNLFHEAIAMYDAWAVYEYGGYAKTYLVGKTINNVSYPFFGVPLITDSTDKALARNTAISFAMYRLLKQRYATAPNAGIINFRIDTLMNNLGFDTSIHAITYSSGNAAHLGNYIASIIIDMGLQDSCNEVNNYTNQNYGSMNPPLFVSNLGNPFMSDINKWQPLYINNALDQNGFPIGSQQTFLGPEWGRTVPFCLQTSDITANTRNGFNYPVYMDPGTPPQINALNPMDSMSMFFKMGHAMVSVWSSMLDPNDTTMVDISPNALGNHASYPSSFADQANFYNYFEGGDSSSGYAINPTTNLPYTPQLVKRGDYTRVVSQYWADGPASEAPPGHWFVLLNEVSDNPLLVKKYEGINNVLTDLEWDVKAYFTLGGAMHDAAVACWGIKGWYDAARPISAIRKMAQFGQSSDSLLPNYNAMGLPLLPGYIELITPTDSLAMVNINNINKIKIKAWRGFSNTTNPNPPIQTPTGVGWILAENWLPYQRKTFVTPPFAGYVSGHSTYSRAGAAVLKNITGDAYFPGGFTEHIIPANSNFLQFETGPSTDVKLQWATYADASDQASLSRIWGGIHPPFDDIKGRLIGQTIGDDAHLFAKNYFEAVTPLALQLVNFKATSQNCLAQLSWQAAFEEDVERYEIWRSIDGINFDNYIGSKKSTQNALAHNYVFEDANPLPKAIYKLQAYDIADNKLAPSFATFNNSNCNTLATIIPSIYPNPVTNVLNINIEGLSYAYSCNVKVYDITGRIVMNKMYEVSSAEKNIKVFTSNLATGSYKIEVAINDANKKYFTIVKQ
jgi:hypothetical protein